MFFVLFPLVPSYFPLMRETDTKKLSNFAKLQVLKYRTYNYAIKTHLSRQIWFFWLVIRINQEFYFSKTAQFFCLSFSNERKLWGSEKKNKKHIFQAKIGIAKCILEGSGSNFLVGKKMNFLINNQFCISILGSWSLLLWFYHINASWRISSWKI